LCSGEAATSLWRLLGWLRRILDTIQTIFTGGLTLANLEFKQEIARKVTSQREKRTVCKGDFILFYILYSQYVI
jgi:hypothetical protein